MNLKYIFVLQTRLITNINRWTDLWKKRMDVLSLHSIRVYCAKEKKIT